MQSVQEAQEKLPFLAARTTRPRPLSEATEILDTDSDSDSFGEYYSNDSPQRSGSVSLLPPRYLHLIANRGSLQVGAESVTTASTPDEVKTPGSTSLTGFHFHIDDNPVAGPVGPHLFRLSGGSSERKSQEIEPLQEDQYPFYNLATKHVPERSANPAPENAKPRNETRADALPLEELAVTTWLPEDVVRWLLQLGFDDEIVEKFFINDISGLILLELQSEDLKELDIPSFGKRHRLLGCIRQLRKSAMGSSSEDSQPSSEVASRETSPTPRGIADGAGSSCIGSPVEEQIDSKIRRERRHHRHHRRRHEVVPEESVSIVAIEQLLPKLHTCSKGENCPKWRKQQAKIARLARNLPIDSFGGSIIFTGDPGNAANAQNLMKTPKSEATPSVVASSDALGPNQPPAQNLSENALNDVQPRDPQENVRNFLSFQRLSRLKPANDPATPPRELFPPLETKSPSTTKSNANLTENLRQLPKLQIPNNHASSRLSPNQSAQRTITPSILQKQKSFNKQKSQRSPAPRESMFSPADYYRADPHYGQTTPWSEVDVPVMDIPFGPVSRDISQSVPPNMRFGGDGQHTTDPIPRPASTKAINHRRKPSFQRAFNFRSLGRLDENDMLSPIDTPEDLETTPRAPHCRKDPFSPNVNGVDDVTHSGWMKKRKSTRLLRHDWEDHHFTLRGTQLAMHADEEASQRNSKALEYIDVDDYAVACSSLPTHSKLTAAFKKTILKRKDDLQDEAAFAFSLIPSPPDNNGLDRKTFLMNGPKAHHFAVKTRDQRIDWMRELMLAKALRRGRESGASVNVNGAIF